MQGLQGCLTLIRGNAQFIWEWGKVALLHYGVLKRAWLDL